MNYKNWSTEFYTSKELLMNDKIDFKWTIEEMYRLSIGCLIILNMKAELDDSWLFC